jgi:hypothetical protein
MSGRSSVLWMVVSCFWISFGAPPALRPPTATMTWRSGTRSPPRGRCRLRQPGSRANGARGRGHRSGEIAGQKIEGAEATPWLLDARGGSCGSRCGAQSRRYRHRDHGRLRPSADASGSAEPLLCARSSRNLLDRRADRPRRLAKLRPACSGAANRDPDQRKLQRGGGHAAGPQDRRLSKNYEQGVQSSETMINVAVIRLRPLTPWPTPTSNGFASSSVQSVIRSSQEEDRMPC